MIAEARDEGILLGEKRGEIRGEKRGISEGIAREKLNIAKSMYDEHIDINTISRVTNLGIDSLHRMFNIN